MNSRGMRTVGIVGLGYVGLPLAAAFAEAGMRTIGVDTNPDKIARLNLGESHVEDVPSESVRRLLENGALHATKDYSELTDADAVLICLPTPLDKNREPDLSAVLSGTEQVAANLSHGALIILESTTYPGTLREVMLPILEREGRRVGEDFYLASSPERIDPGNKKHTLADMPKVVGGLTESCTKRASTLYERIVEKVHPVSSPESAELSKLLENIFRGVNIALVNELAVLCNRMGIDVWEVVDAASTKPFGFMPFYPGPGLGGHCIPIDPFYLSWRARAFDMTTEFIELAGRININMPYYAVSRISNVLNLDKKPLNGSHILLLGMSYKPNVGDLRESPSLELLRLLSEAGADVRYHDRHVPELLDWKMQSVDLTSQELESADCVVIATDHDSVDLASVVSSSNRVMDLRNAVRKRLDGPLPANVEVL